MADGTDKHAGMDGRQRAAAAKKAKKDELDNLKKEVEMVETRQNHSCPLLPTTSRRS